MPERSKASVRIQLKVMPHEWELVLMRSQMAPRVSLAAPFILALAKGAGSAPWRAALRWSLKAVSMLLPTKYAELQ